MSAHSAPVEAIARAGGVRVSGPGALSGGWRRMVHLSWTLSTLEFRLKFFGSVLGYLWQLGRPLLLFGVYYLVFTQFVDIGGEAQNYAPNLLMGVMLYQFFAEATSASVRAVVDRENLVRKISFPRIVIPTASVLTAVFNLSVNLVAVFVFIELSGVEWRWSFIELFPLLGMLVALCFGLAMLLSALFVRYRDVQPIWEVVVMAAFYATPILYPLETVKLEWARDVIMYNPLAVIVQQIRHAMFDPSAASAVDAIGGWPQLMVPVGIVAGTLVLGFWYYNRQAPHVAEDL
jgi:ABC-2 type transport system permease protein